MFLLHALFYKYIVFCWKLVMIWKMFRRMMCYCIVCGTGDSFIQVGLVLTMDMMNSLIKWSYNHMPAADG